MFDDFEASLPKDFEALQKSLSGCYSKGKFVKAEKDDVESFLHKAWSDFELARDLLNEEHFDWCVNVAYTSMYRSASAFLIKFNGHYAKDHGCTLFKLLEIMQSKDFSKKYVEVQKLVLEELRFIDIMRQIRNKNIYEVNVIDEKTAQKALNECESFFQHVKELVG